MPIFLYTLAFHEKYFDWTIVSNLKAADLPYPGCPRNLHIVDMSYDQFLSKVRKLVPVELPPVEKIGVTDFKPYFGELFYSQLSKEHTHWGWSDIDMFLGDLSMIGRTVGLAETDAICTDPDICANGPMAILRKTDFMIHLHREMDHTELTKRLPFGGSAMVDEVLYRDLLKEKFKSKKITMYTDKSLFGGYEPQYNFWFFYKGVVHCPDTVQCILMHFGGGQRAQQLRDNEWSGMKEFFDKKLDQNPDNIILRCGHATCLSQFIFLHHNNSGIFPFDTTNGLADWKRVPLKIKSLVRNTVFGRVNRMPIH